MRLCARQRAAGCIRNLLRRNADAGLFHPRQPALGFRMKRQPRLLCLHLFFDRFEHEAVWRYNLLPGQLVNALLYLFGDSERNCRHHIRITNEILGY